MKRYKNLIYFAAIPLVTIVGTVIFGNRIYAWLTLAVAVLSCVPFFIGFEKKRGRSAKTYNHLGDDLPFGRRKIYFRADPRI